MTTHGKSSLTEDQAALRPRRAGELLSVLADPTRRTILEMLLDSPKPVVELARGLPVSRPAVSQHLKVLKAAGLVRDRQDANRRIYTLDAAALAPLMSYLDQFWATALHSYARAASRRRESRKV